MRKILCALPLIIIIFYSCKSDLPFTKEEDTFLNAKPWFNSKLSKELNPLFFNLIFHWENASTFTFKNGYKALTVPITERNQNPAYRGRRILYLFPWKNGKGYYATIYEIIPTLEHLKINKGSIDLKMFSGYISTWDLKLGFVRGVQYSSGIPEKNINIEIKELLPSAVTNTVNNSDPITLPNITVIGYLPGPNTGSYWITLMNSLGYSTSYLWSGGDGNNPCEYTGCNYSENPYDYFNSNTVNQISQKLLDQQWQNENVIDSTNNPCVTNTLNQLLALNDCLPALIRNFFNADGNFTMTMKMADLGPDAGASVPFNAMTNNFQVKINSYYSETTDLGLAATIIHEAFHCQLMSWYREAIIENNQVRKEQLAADYGYLFSKEITSLDSSLSIIVNGGNPTQHHDMVFRYNDIIANALYEYALSKDINIDLSYCKDLAWAGTFDSQAFNSLSLSDQRRISNRVNAEKDHNGDKGLNTFYVSPKGTPCLD